MEEILIRKLKEEDLKEISIEKARKIQSFIAKNLIKEEVKDLRIAAGLDSAYSKDLIFTAIVFFDLKEKKIIHEEYRINKVTFPYIPTLLFLREGPSMVKTAENAKSKADVYLVDGHGEAHPYRAGLACFVGYLLNKPTIGVAKKKLFGTLKMLNHEGYLEHEGEEIAKVIEICGKRFFISVGNKITLRLAFEVFKETIVGCEPLPLRRAHILANNARAKHERGN